MSTTTTTTLQAEHERQRVIRASAFTFGFAGALLLLAILVKWPLPTIPQEIAEEPIEVNLGSSDDGFGSDQPLLPGDPAPEAAQEYTPPQVVSAAPAEAREVETDDSDPSAPAITRPPVSSPKAQPREEPVATRQPTVRQEPAANPTPPRPKATMTGVRGGTGSGGNGADTYQPGGSEGNGSGSGDKGVPGGNPNGTAYTGTPRRLGARVVSIPPQNFEDDFKESGKVILDVVVNENGKLVSATYQPRGSTITNRKQIEQARRWASQITFPKYEGGFRQPLEVAFTVRN